LREIGETLPGPRWSPPQPAMVSFRRSMFGGPPRAGHECAWRMMDDGASITISRSVEKAFWNSAAEPTSRRRHVAKAARS